MCSFHSKFYEQNSQATSKSYHVYFVSVYIVVVLKGHKRAVNRVSWPKLDSDSVLSASQDMTVKLW